MLLKKGLSILRVLKRGKSPKVRVVFKLQKED